jgi:hypothetical protein
MYNTQKGWVGSGFACVRNLLLLCCCTACCTQGNYYIITHKRVGVCRERERESPIKCGSFLLGQKEEKTHTTHSTHSLTQLIQLTHSRFFVGKLKSLNWVLLVTKGTIGVGVFRVWLILAPSQNQLKISWKPCPKFSCKLV